MDLGELRQVQPVIIDDPPQDRDPLLAREGVERHIPITDPEKAVEDLALARPEVIGVGRQPVHKGPLAQVEEHPRAVALEVREDAEEAGQPHQEDDVEIGDPLVEALEEGDRLGEVVEQPLIGLAVANHPIKYLRQEKGERVTYRIKSDSAHRQAGVRLREAVQVPFRKMSILDLQQRQGHEKRPRDFTAPTPWPSHHIRTAPERLRIHIYNRAFIVIRSYP